MNHKDKKITDESDLSEYSRIDLAGARRWNELVAKHARVPRDDEDKNDERASAAVARSGIDVEALKQKMIETEEKFRLYQEAIEEAHRSGQYTAWELYDAQTQLNRMRTKQRTRWSLEANGTPMEGLGDLSRRYDELIESLPRDSLRREREREADGEEDEETEPEPEEDVEYE